MSDKNTFLIQPEHAVGDKVLVLFRTINYNSGYFITECEVEEIVRCLPDSEIMYRLRLPDKSISVVAEEDCYGNIEELKQKLADIFEKNEVPKKRVESAIARYDETIGEPK